MTAAARAVLAASVVALAHGLCVAWAPPVSATGVDPRVYDPALSTSGLLSVEGSAPAPHLRLWGGLVGSWANDELVTRVGDGDDALTLGPLRNRFITTAAVGLGLFDVADVALGVPLHVTELQGIADTARDLRAGLGDLRVFLRARAFGPPEGTQGVGLALLLDATLPTGGDADYRGDGAVTLTPRLALDYRGAGGLLVALNVGYRLRPTREVVDLAIGDELKLGVGAELPLRVWNLSATGEVYGALGFGESARDRAGLEARKAPFEALGGLRWRGPAGVVLSAAVGAGFTAGYGAADYRVAFALTLGGPEVAPFEEPLVDAEGHVATGPVYPVAAEPDEPPEPAPGDAPAAVAVAASIDPETFDAVAAADPDPDGDAIAGAADACPDAPEDRDGFADDDGCPDPDNDGDGIPDAADKCPNERENVNGVEDDDGCADEGEAPTGAKREGARISFEGVIRFRPGSAELTPKSERVLDAIAVVMKRARDVRRFRIEGHTDSVGDREFNVDLSERRAAAVRRYLIEKGGIAPERLFAKGYGATRPIASNRVASGRAKNRRVEFYVIGPGEDGWVPEDQEGGR